EDEPQPPRLALTGSDADGDTLAVSIVRYPEHGRVFGVPPDVQYYPAGDYNGRDSFQFVVNDGQETSLPATVTLDMTPVSDRPVAFDDSIERPARVPARIPVADLLANDVDVDGDVLRVTGVSPSSFNVQARLEGDEVVITAPKRGDYIVTYDITDG